MRGGLGLLLRLLLSLLAVGGLYFGVDTWALRTWDNRDSLVVRLLEAGPEVPVPSEGGDERFPTLQRGLRLHILSGASAGVNAEVTSVRLAGSGVDLIPGRRYLLVEDTFEDGSVQYSIADAYRVPLVVAMVAAACLLLLAFMERRGFRALLGLTLSVAVVVWGMIPMMAEGWSPVPVAFLTVLVISAATVACVVRRPRCRTAALLGSLGGTAFGFLLGALMVWTWQLTGLAGDGSALLASTLPGIDMRGVLLAAVLVGAIGGVLDVGISVTASMAELTDYDPSISLRRLWLAGLSVGGEMLGSMINTLILAYMGSSLSMAILISSAGVNFMGLLNDPYIGQEITQSLAGTVGLLFTVPASAFFFTLQEALDRKNRRRQP